MVERKKNVGKNSDSSSIRKPKHFYNTEVVPINMEID